MRKVTWAEYVTFHDFRFVKTDAVIEIFELALCE